MRTWQDRVSADGATLIADGVIANNTPDEMAISDCKDLGEKAAKL